MRLSIEKTLEILMKIITALLLSLISTFALANALQAPEGAEAYFISPANGEVIEGPVHVVMGLKGMGVAPAGVSTENTGHHHLIINASTPEAGKPIGKDENHRHFGGGQTEAVIDLPAGEHTLQLVLGDFAHRPHANPVVSEVITIIVK